MISTSPLTSASACPMRCNTGSDCAIGSALPEPNKLSPRSRTVLRSASSVTVTRPCLTSGSRKRARRGVLASAGGAICTLGTRSDDTAE